MLVNKLNIPEPFKSDEFVLLQKGIYDAPGVNVYVNMQNDFVFIDPQPEYDYTQYVPRVEKLSLEKYKQKRMSFERRFTKISYLLKERVNSLIEIGAGDGSFLEIIKETFPHILLAAVEPDVTTLSIRKNKNYLQNYKTLNDVCDLNIQYDVICFFHVLEHLTDPASFLDNVRKLMHRNSIVIIEVPSLFDPLLTLYDCESYKQFYFQLQHPFVYSHQSLVRLMVHNNIQPVTIINYQRYGLENHLNWIIKSEPGGNELYKAIFHKTDQKYITELEEYGKTDSVVFVGKLKY